MKYTVSIFLFLAFMLGITTGALWMYSVMPDPGSPVCHSITEDSIIWDCDYRKGGWYRK